MRGPRSVRRRASLRSSLSSSSFRSCLTSFTMTSLTFVDCSTGARLSELLGFHLWDGLRLCRTAGALVPRFPRRNDNAPPPPCGRGFTPPLPAYFAVARRGRYRPLRAEFGVLPHAVLIGILPGYGVRRDSTHHGSFLARSHRTRRTLRATVRYWVRLERLSVIQNVFLLAAFFVGVRSLSLPFAWHAFAGRWAAAPVVATGILPSATTAIQAPRPVMRRSSMLAVSATLLMLGSSVAGIQPEVATTSCRRFGRYRDRSASADPAWTCV